MALVFQVAGASGSLVVVVAVSIPMASLVVVPMSWHIVVVVIVPLKATRVVVVVTSVVPNIMARPSAAICSMRAMPVRTSDVEMHVPSTEMKAKASVAMGGAGNIRVSAYKCEGSNSGNCESQFSHS